jgi:hypothetical protein
LAKKERSAGSKTRHEATTATGDFRCGHCRALVAAVPPGTRHRNHCPHCLWSLHVDSEQGDRASSCGGLMEPVGVWVKSKGEWALFHRCERCNRLSVNRISGDDNQLALISLALRPIAFPPFPLIWSFEDAVLVTEPSQREVAQ